MCPAQRLQAGAPIDFPQMRHIKHNASWVSLCRSSQSLAELRSALKPAASSSRSAVCVLLVWACASPALRSLSRHSAWSLLEVSRSCSAASRALYAFSAEANVSFLFLDSSSKAS